MANKLFYDKLAKEVTSGDFDLSLRCNAHVVELARLRRQIEERLRLNPKLVVSMAKLLKLI